jgi:hypothetical protein
MINFPATTGQPTDGSFTHSEVGLTWTWNGTTWDVEGGGGAAGPDGCYVGDTPPAGAEPGWLWWNSAEGILYVWYDDGDTQQWVEANPGVPGPAGPVGPAGPTAVSANTGNASTLGSDGLIFTPAQRAVATAAQAQAWTDNTVDLTPLQLAQAFKGSNQVFSTSAGYQRLPGGIIMQWGTGILPWQNVSRTVVFPIAFPNGILTLQGTINYPADKDAVLGLSYATSTTMTAGQNSQIDQQYQWLAIGF